MPRFWERQRTAESYEDILARCLATVEDGSATIESCLAAYPEHADRLGPAIRTVLAVKQGMAVEPSAAFAQRTRARVLAAASGIREVSPNPVRGGAAPTPLPTPITRARRAYWAPLAISGAAAALVLGGFVPFAAVSSESAVPGDWNYGIKRATERARLAVTFDDEDRHTVHLSLAERRSEELAELVRLQRESLVQPVAKAYQAELQAATEPLRRESPPPPQQVRRIEASVAKQETVIRSALARVQQETPAAVAAVAPSAAPTVAPTAPVAAPSAVPAAASPVPTATPTPPRPDTLQTARALQSALSAATETRERVAETRDRTDDVTVAVTATRTATATATPEPTATPTATATATATPTATPAPTVAPTAAPTAVVTRPPTTASASAPATASGPAPTGTNTATATAVPSRTPTATATATATATSTPAPSRTPTPVAGTPGATAAPPRTATPPLEPRTATVDLVPGFYTFVYVGPTQPIDTALQLPVGRIAWVEWSPSGSPFAVRYQPGISTDRPLLTPNARVTMFVNSPTVFPLGNIAGLAPVR